MRFAILFAVAVMAIVVFAPVSEAANGRGLLGIRGRRAEGRGVLQGSGPVRRVFGSCGRGGCG